MASPSTSWESGWMRAYSISSSAFACRSPPYQSQSLTVPTSVTVRVPTRTKFFSRVSTAWADFMSPMAW